MINNSFENFNKKQKHNAQNKKITSGTMINNDNESSKLTNIKEKKLVFKLRLFTKDIIKNNDTKLDMINTFDIKIFFIKYLPMIINSIKPKINKNQECNI